MVNSMIKKYCVYELWNPITDKIFYVGKTFKKSKRYIDHLKVARQALKGKHSRNYKINTILSILHAGLKPIEKIVFETYDEQEALNKEIELIKFYGRSDIGTGILTNHTDGGDTTIGYKRPIGWKDTCYARLHLSKPIYAINEDGTIFKEFISTKDVDNYFRKDLHSKLSNVARKNKHYTINGYFWRYKDEYDSNEDFSKYNIVKHLKNPCKIAQIRMSDLKIIKIWDSVNIIKEQLDVSNKIYSGIAQNKPYKDYYWCNVDKDSTIINYDKLIPYISAKGKNIKIELINTLDNSIMESFDSIIEASRILNVSRDIIYNRLKTKTIIDLSHTMLPTAPYILCKLENEHLLP